MPTSLADSEVEMKLYCAECGKYMGEIERARFRKGYKLTIVCRECRDGQVTAMPEFMQRLFR